MALENLQEKYDAAVEHLFIYPDGLVTNQHRHAYAGAKFRTTVGDLDVVIERARLILYKYVALDTDRKQVLTAAGIEHINGDQTDFRATNLRLAGSSRPPFLKIDVYLNLHVTTEEPDAHLQMLFEEYRKRQQHANEIRDIFTLYTGKAPVLGEEVREYLLGKFSGD